MASSWPTEQGPAGSPCLALNGLAVKIQIAHLLYSAVVCTLVQSVRIETHLPEPMTIRDVGRANYGRLSHTQLEKCGILKYANKFRVWRFTTHPEGL